MIIARTRHPVTVALEPKGYTLQPRSDPFKWAGGDLGNHYKMPGNSFDGHWHPSKGGNPDWSVPYRTTKLNSNTELFVRLLGVRFYVVEADGRAVGPLGFEGVPFVRKVAGSALKPPAADPGVYETAQGAYGKGLDFKGLWYLAGKDGKPDWSRAITQDITVNSNLSVFARVVGATLYVREPPEGGAAVGRDFKVGGAELARGDALPEPGPAFEAAEAAYNRRTGPVSHLVNTRSTRSRRFLFQKASRKAAHPIGFSAGPATAPAAIRPRRAKGPTLEALPAPDGIRPPHRSR